MTGLILYGDSVFFGYGASNKNSGCGRQLKTRLSIPVIIKAKNSITTQDALAGLQNNVLSSDYAKYSDVIVLFGNNDCRLIMEDTPKIPLDKYKNNLIEIISLIASSGKKCYISNLQPLNDLQVMRVVEEIRNNMKQLKSPYLWQKQYSDTCKEVATICNIPLIDIRTPLENASADIFFEDGMHPNDHGHSIISNAIYAALIKPNVTMETAG